MTIDEALDPFGGRNRRGAVTDLAKAIGVAVSTVHSWVLKGTIPSWRVPQIEAAHSAKRDLDAKGGE